MLYVDFFLSDRCMWIDLKDYAGMRCMQFVDENLDEISMCMLLKCG
jgi:hypothetical protein